MMATLDLDALTRELSGMERRSGTDLLTERVSCVPTGDNRLVMFGLKAVPKTASARAVVGNVAVLLGVTKVAAARAVGVSSHRLRRDQTVSLQVLDRVLALCRQWFLVHRVVGAKGAGSWFQDENPGLEAARPIELLATGHGQQRADALIQSLLYGGVIQDA